MKLKLDPLSLNGVSVESESPVITGGVSSSSGGGGNISGTIAATQVAFGTDTDEIGGVSGFTFDGTNTTLTLTKANNNEANALAILSNTSTGDAYARFNGTSSSFGIGVDNSANTMDITWHATAATMSNNRILRMAGSATDSSRNLFTGANVIQTNFGVRGSSALNGSTAATATLLSQNSTGRVFLNGGTTGTVSANGSMAQLYIGPQPVTKAGSGTHNLFAQAAIRGLNINNAGGTLSNAATLYIEGPATGAGAPTNNYALWVDDGPTRLDGTLNTHTIPGGTGTLALTSDIPADTDDLPEGTTNEYSKWTLTNGSVGSNNALIPKSSAIAQINIIPNNVTYTTTSLPSNIIWNNIQTINAAGGTAPAAIDYVGVMQAQQSLSGFGAGILFAARATLKNVSGVTANLAGFHSYSNQTVYQADNANIIAGFTIGFLSQPSFNRINSGTITQGEYHGFYGVGTIGAGATLTNFKHILLLNPTVNGTLENLYGAEIASQTSGSVLNVGLAIGTSTTVALWLGHTTTSTTESGGIVFGSGRDVNLYRSAANTLKTDDTFQAAAGITETRVTPRVGSTASSATPTINTDNVDMYGLTAQAADITSFTTNLSGTPTNGQKLWIYVVGTASRVITWGASFEAGVAALPTTTTNTERLDVFFIWNAVTNRWRCMAAGSA